MAYTEENFQEWIFFIGFKMEYVTGEFAEKENLTLDYSIQSLDAVEAWLLEHYEDHHKLIEDKEILDQLSIYVGETFRKYLGGKWFINLSNKKNVYYGLPVLTNLGAMGDVYECPLTFCTACISRKDGQYISKILRYLIELSETIKKNRKEAEKRERK